MAESTGFGGCSVDAAPAIGAIPGTTDGGGAIGRFLPGSSCRSRHTSATVTRSMRWRPSAMPVNSALSQITLIVQAIPPDSSWIKPTASRVKLPARDASGGADAAGDVAAVSASSNGWSRARSATRCFNCRRLCSSSRCASSGWPARTTGSNFPMGSRCSQGGGSPRGSRC